MILKIKTPQKEQNEIIQTQIFHIHLKVEHTGL